jgi:TPR repeat protein
MIFMMFRFLAISSFLLALLTSDPVMAMEDESTESGFPVLLKRGAAEERLPEAISKKQKATRNGNKTFQEERLRRHLLKIHQLNQDANNGLPEAQRNLAELLRAGLFDKDKGRWLAAPEPLRAKELFEAAARQGNPKAQSNLAHMLQWGVKDRNEKWVIKPDRLKAKELLETAAKNGLSKAQCNLGNMLWHGVQDEKGGWLIEPDPLRAKTYYKAAARQGDRYAKCQIASMFRFGVSDRKGGWCIEQNSLKAKKWSARADEGIIQ